MSPITVYTKSSCRQCVQTKRVLDKEGLEYSEVNIEDDMDARQYVTGDLGYVQAPVVVAGDEHWAGFRPQRIKDLARLAAS